MNDTHSGSATTIELMENGPLIVKGLKKLEGPDGTQMEVKEVIALCRCGASENKPFCDGTHKSIGYTGARESERSVHASKAYRGEEITIHDNRAICAHAGYCVADLKSVFQLEERPWIDPNGASVEEVKELVHRCPSGALSYEIKGEKSSAFEQEELIRIAAGGPYEVLGGTQLDVNDDLTPPIPSQYTLCRCGASKNKPYCDGSHHNLDEGWDK